jgi:PAS domain S-box-containing protein
MVPIAMTDAEIRDAAGRVVGFVTVSMDVTERKKGEEALRRSEERYRLFFEDDLTGDYVATVEGDLQSCNLAFAHIFGFDSVEQALRVNLFTLYPHDAARDDLLRGLQEHRRLNYHEMDLVRPDGRQVHVVENVIGEFDTDDRLKLLKGYMFDDTDRKRLEDQLRQAQKMDSIGTLASGIAHDFNNILNNVLGFSMQIQKHASDPARVTKYSQTIERSASRGAELSAQLLSFARMSKREKVPLDVAHVVDEVASLCRETFPRTIDVVRRLEATPWHVLGDKGELYQVLLNLAVNARDAIQQKAEGTAGKVTIEFKNLRPDDDSATALLPGGPAPCVEIRVTDTGVGIPKTIRDRIFDPFFTTKERGRGTGLGLAVVYTVVRNHRGVLLVESEEGAGSTFRVLLPAVEDREPPQPSVPVHSAQEQGRGVVLIVDDEEPMQDLGRELLEEQGYSVLIASSGARAIEIYRERSGEIDLVVLDLVMTGLDGSQTYQELKKLNPQVRVLFCTGYMPDQIINALVEQDHLECIQKPFNPETFITLVHEQMKKRVS